MADSDMMSPSDPLVIIEGIKQFGLAPDGSDLRDLKSAYHEQAERIAELEDQLQEMHDTWADAFNC